MAASRADELKQTFSCDVSTDVEAMIDPGKIDAAIVAAPTSLHRQIGGRLLRRGIHCLLEKPMASTAQECRELNDAAKYGNAIVQVGHVERFNPAWIKINEHLSQPKYIQATREGQLTFRSMDGGAVLDLMIHDIDLVLSIVKSPVLEVRAEGANWTGPSEDLAHAWIRFANGCVAALSCSRVASEPQRKMRIYGDDWLGEIDFGSRSAQMLHAPVDKTWQSRSYPPEERARLMDSLFTSVLSRKQLAVPDGNAILDEQRDFVTSIETHSSPIVSGRDGLAAVELAHEIIRQVRGEATIASYRKAG